MAAESDSAILCFDGHLDLAMNALEWNRDQRWTVKQIRVSEAGLTDKPDRGRNTVSFPALRQGKVGLVVATQIARVVKPGSPLPGWHSQEQAWAFTRAQLEWYRTMEAEGELRQIVDGQSLEAALSLWDNPGENTPLCYLQKAGKQPPGV